MNILPIFSGATALPDGSGVSYRVWAPEKRRVDVVLASRTVSLTASPDGYFEGTDPEGRPGDRYKFRLDADENQTFPDPCSRFQPDGVHGPSMVMPPSPISHPPSPISHLPSLPSLIIYELHVGTFTPEGTFLAAIGKLDHLVSLGVTALELMPLADFPGRWNWGYDGVFLYAPSRAYGHPDGLRALIAAAHERGLLVILDAVYNHLGPDGNYLGAYTKDYFNPAHKTPWGDALNFDGHHHGPVRDFFVGNVIYWMEQFGFDGFRLDAIHAIMDESERHVLAAIAEAIHARGGFVFAEDERNAAFLATPEADGGAGLDGLWADDFHHSVRVALTGEQESYLQNFTGTTGELADTLAHGWHYRGQPTRREGEPRGTESSHLPPHAFCCCISNHDQVGNRAFGERLTAACSPEAYRAASALLCLVPYTPLIFQGQEWAASTPFLYFTDHHEELGRLVTAGRRREFKGFASFTDEIPDPQAESTFQSSKLDWTELSQAPHAATLALYREALRLRREERSLQNRRDRTLWRVTPFGGDAIGLTYTALDPAEMLLIVCSLKGNAANAIGLDAAPAFDLIFSTNEARFGGDGKTAFDPADATMTFRRPELLILKARLT